MATSETVDRTAVSGAHLSTQEEPAEEHLVQTPDRRHVDDLLDISEEGFLKELEPHENHTYSGWDEAVRGWARAAPLSSIFLSPRRNKNRISKQADSPGRLSVDLALPNVDRSASVKKSTEVNQSAGSWSDTAMAALQKDASESPVFDAFWKNMSDILPEENPKKKGTLKDSPVKNKLSKIPRSGHRSNNTVVPIKQFTFLPPIEELQLSPQTLNEQLSSQKLSEGENTEKNSFMFDRKGGMKGARADTVMNQDSGLYSRLHVSQCNSQLLSAFSVSIPNRYQGSLSSNRDAAHQTHPSVGKRALYSGAAAHESAPMYAVSL